MARREWRALALCAGLCIAAAAPATGGQGAPYGQGGFAPTPVALPTMADVPNGQTAMMDVNGFGSPVPAYAFTRPDGWRVDEATYAWSKQPCTSVVPMSRLRLTSPEGAVILSSGERGWVDGIDRMRAFFRQRGVAMPPAFHDCRDAPATTAENFLRQVLGASRPGMRVLSARARPDVVEKAYADMLERDALMPPDQRTAQYNPRFDAAELVIAYEGPAGPAEEIALTVLAAVDLPAGAQPITVQFTSGVMSMAGPAGRLDKGALDQVWRTMAPLPAYAANAAQKQAEIGRMAQAQMSQWENQAQARLAAHQRKRSGGRLLRSAGGGASFNPAATSQSILDSSHASFMKRSGSSDRSQAGGVDAINETTTVYDPYHGYDVAVQGTGVDVWQTKTGDIFTTDSSAHYDPMSSGMDATKLEPISSGSSSSSDTSWIWE